MEITDTHSDGCLARIKKSEEIARAREVRQIGTKWGYYQGNQQIKANDE